MTSNASVNSTMTSMTARKKAATSDDVERGMEKGGALEAWAWGWEGRREREQQPEVADVSRDRK